MAAAPLTPASPPPHRTYSNPHPPRHHPLRSRVTSHVTNHVTPLLQSWEREGRRVNGRGRGGGGGGASGREGSNGREGVRAGGGGGGGGGEGSGGDSTTEEVDNPPNESSTTTDTIPEPVDFIDCGVSIPRAYSTSAIPFNGHHHSGTSIHHRVAASSSNFEVDRGGGGGGGGGTRGVLMRKGKQLRGGGSKERQRVPHPVPRNVKIKPQHTRPVPLSRKRRYSGRLSHLSHSVSEGDMAMADEMGEGEGEEGGDDGFVDGPGGEAVKRRNKKRGVFTIEKDNIELAATSNDL